MDIATTIISKLGGEEFLASKSASDVFKSDCSVSFSLPQGSVKKGINCAFITKTGDNAYRLLFFKKLGNTFGKVRGKAENIPGCNLLETYNSLTVFPKRKRNVKRISIVAGDVREIVYKQIDMVKDGLDSIISRSFRTKTDGDIVEFLSESGQILGISCQITSKIFTIKN